MMLPHLYNFKTVLKYISKMYQTIKNIATVHH